MALGPPAFAQDGEPGEDFGHLHTELCFPHNATVSGEMTLDVTSIMHHNPGDFFRLVIQIWAEDWEPVPSFCGEGAAVAAFGRVRGRAAAVSHVHRPRARVAVRLAPRGH